jgi:beta-glucosidase
MTINFAIKKIGNYCAYWSIGRCQRKYGGNLERGHQTRKLYFVACRNKIAVGASAKVLYAKGSNLDYDAALEEKGTMFGKTLHRDNRTKEELLAEALENCQSI